jgi:pimeloyl-ACP methyl ester carboxylesterase
MRRFTVWLAAAVWGFSALSVQAAALTLKPIEFKASDGRTTAAEWGEITVREDRRDPKSRPLKLAFVRFKATTAKPGAPIVYLAGGPGGSGIAAARGVRFDVFMKLRETADVIAFDQRGTGSSTGVPPCDAPKLDLSRTLTREVVTAHYVAGLKVCWEQWKAQGIAIGAYNTVENAADLDELRRDLGAKRLNLWGISYGTHLGLAYMKLYPKRVDRAVLASVEGLDQTVKLPAHADAALARIAAAVAADPDAATPDLLGLMRRVHSKLDAAPARFPLPPNSPDGPAFIADSFGIKGMAGILIKDPETIGQMVQLYKAMDAGAYAAVGPLIGPQLLGQLRTHAGMAEAMDLASGISSPRAAQVEREAKEALLGDALNFPMPQAAGAIPGIDLGERFRGPFRSNIPTLMLSGDLDGRTPLEEQAEATSGLKRLSQIIVHGAGHDIFEAEPRLWPLMADFFAGKPVASQEITRPLDIVPARRPAPR